MIPSNSVRVPFAEVKNHVGGTYLECSHPVTGRTYQSSDVALTEMVVSPARDRVTHVSTAYVRRVGPIRKSGERLLTGFYPTQWNSYADQETVEQHQHLLPAKVLIDDIHFRIRGTRLSLPPMLQGIVRYTSEGEMVVTREEGRFIRDGGIKYKIIDGELRRLQEGNFLFHVTEPRRRTVAEFLLDLFGENRPRFETRPLKELSQHKVLIVSDSIDDLQKHGIVGVYNRLFAKGFVDPDQFEWPEYVSVTKEYEGEVLPERIKMNSLIIPNRYKQEGWKLRVIWTFPVNDDGSFGEPIPTKQLLLNESGWELGEIKSTLHIEGRDI